MRKIPFILFIIACLLTSCETHEHTYKSEWNNDKQSHWKECICSDCDSIVAFAEHSFELISDDNQNAQACTVCGYIKIDSDASSDHTHNFSTGYTSDNQYHWSVCIECSLLSQKDEHIWGESTVIEPSTSEKEGMAGQTCLICGRYSVKTLERLPEKMSRDDWVQLFQFDNLRISESVKTGSLSSTDSVYSVDGDLVSVLSGGYTEYSSRKVIKQFDLSDYYDAFSHYGESIYRASEIDLDVEDIPSKLSDVYLTVKDGQIESMGFSVKLGNIFGTFTYSYIFYDRGLVELNPSRLTRELLNEIVKEDKYAANIHLLYNKVSSSGTVSEINLTVLNGEYTCKNYTDGRLVKTKKGESVDVAKKISENLSMVLNAEIISSESFVYEIDYNDYVYVGEPIDAGEIGVLIDICLSVEDGRLTSLYYETSEGNMYNYEFTYY